MLKSAKEEQQSDALPSGNTPVKTRARSPILRGGRVLLQIALMLGTIVFSHGAKGFFFNNQGGGWEYPAFWAIALIVQALIGPGAAAISKE